MLKFSRGNAKLDALESMVGGQVWTFSLLSGHTCPFAQDCYSKAVDIDGKRSVVDGPETLFRCFSASQEALYPAVFNARKHNTDEIKACGNNLHKITLALVDAIPQSAKAVRIHVGGDFFTLNYMMAWMETARLFPAIRFYAYTKSLPMWVSCLTRGLIPANFILTASRGGKADELIDTHNLRESRVVFSVDEAAQLGLEIDHDDSHAAFAGPSFALLIHGMQPKGSDAGKAVRALNGLGSYGKGDKQKDV